MYETVYNFCKSHYSQIKSYYSTTPSKIERATQDIDGDWVGKLPTMEEMEKALRDAVVIVDSSLDVQANRFFSERRSAGFKIINENGEKIASIDLSVRQNPFCKPYISYVNRVSIEGASLSKMLADKVYAISGENVCRRKSKLNQLFFRYALLSLKEEVYL